MHSSHQQLVEISRTDFLYNEMLVKKRKKFKIETTETNKDHIELQSS